LCFLKEDFEVILEIIKDVLCQPLLTEESLEKIKTKVLNNKNLLIKKINFHRKKIMNKSK
jgi:predicted Zn-dependent peptidase